MQFTIRLFQLKTTLLIRTRHDCILILSVYVSEVFLHTIGVSESLLLFRALFLVVYRDFRVHMYAYAYVCRYMYMCISFAVSVACTLQVFWALVHG